MGIIRRIFGAVVVAVFTCLFFCAAFLNLLFFSVTFLPVLLLGRAVSLKSRWIFWATKLGFAKPRVRGPSGPYSTQARRHQAVVDFMIASGIPKNGSLCDVGCGPGYLLDRLHQNGFKNLSGCDWLEQDLEKADYKKIDFNKKALSQYADASFDVVVCSEVLEHMENPALMLRELRRILKPNGHCIVSVPNAANLFERIHFLFTGNSRRYNSERNTSPHSHISFFTSNIIESLQDRAQLELVKTGGDYVYNAQRFWPNVTHPLLSFSRLYYFRPLPLKEEKIATKLAI